MGQQVVDEGQEVVARITLHGPGGGQVFAWLEYFFHYDGGVAAGGVPQAMKIFFGVVQPVDMVYAQALEHTLLHEPEHQAVVLVEYFGVLNVEADEGVDGKET